MRSKKLADKKPKDARSDPKIHLPALCDWCREGGTLNSYAEIAGNPSYKMLWRMLNADTDWRTKYFLACKDRADFRADRVDAIIQDMRDKVIDPQAARVAIDAIKWQTACENRAKYGDKQQVDVNDITTISDAELRFRAAKLLAIVGVSCLPGGVDQAGGGEEN